MQKVIVIPDSFKGSMTSQEVADILAESIEEHLKCEVVRLPIADGGEGSMDCILRAKGGSRKTVTVHSPEGKLIEVAYGILPDGTAVLEIAESSGLTKQTGFRALEASTYGFGELIRAALDEGCRKFFLCLGGSATTDCGCGMAAALGITFFDRDGRSFVPAGGTLSAVSQIDCSGLDQRIGEAEFTVMSDVTNPLYGPLGAAYIYAPQKGATKEEVAVLDAGLIHVAEVIEHDCQAMPPEAGAGAAGGAGYGCTAFLRAKTVSGIEGMLELCQFDALVKDCDLVVTGEGCLDEQSLMGKVLSGIRKHAGNRETVSFCGICKVPAEELCRNRVTAVEIARGISIQESMEKGQYYLKLAADTYFKRRMG